MEYLPIMDYKNKSISLENITSFDVNKSIQRSLTKALARHGLGLYLYAGEDLPEIEVEKISAKDAKILQVAGCNSSATGVWFSTDGKTWGISNITGKLVNKQENFNGIWVAYESSSNSDFGLWYSTITR